MAHARAVGNSPAEWIEAPSDAASASLADDPGFLLALDDLDRGVFGFITDARKMAQRPPLIAQLVVPGTRPIDRRRLQGSRTVAFPARRSGVSVWAASWLVLAALTGASVAGLVFHSRLSDMIARWEGARRETGVVVLRASVR